MIVKYGELSKFRKLLKGEKIVCGGGAFDILHLGHIEFLKKLKSQGTKSVILVNSDMRIREKKGKFRPINSQISRAKMLDSIKYVDYVVLCPPGNASTERCLSIIKPAVFFTVYPRRWKNQKAFFQENGINFRGMKMKKKLNSSTRIIRKLNFSK